MLEFTSKEVSDSEVEKGFKNSENDGFKL